jgi:dethiobiotin synthetase
MDFKVILIEGAGGLLCPITSKKTIFDVAQRLRCPFIIVARNQLGVLNHTLLTIEVVRKYRQLCSGIVLNTIEKRRDLSQRSNAKLLANLTGVPIYVNSNSTGKMRTHKIRRR